MFINNLLWTTLKSNEPASWGPESIILSIADFSDVVQIYVKEIVLAFCSNESKQLT